MTLRAPPADSDSRAEPGRRLKAFPVVSALGAPGLAVTGLVTRVSELHAAGVPMHAGITELSPADYFEEGVAVIARPAAIVLLGVLAFCVPLAVWVPLAAGLMPLLFLARVNARYRLLDFRSWDAWTGAHARASVIALAATFALMAGLHCYFDPPPLDLASVHTTRGTLLVGELLAEANGSVYLAVASGQRHIVRIESLSLSASYPSLAAAGTRNFTGRSQK